MNHTLRAAILNALLLTGGGVLHVEAAHAQSTTQAYRIAPGMLDDALTQFASQNRLQLIYSADLVAGKRSKGLIGSHAPQEALRRLLEGSGLETQRVDGNTILLKKADAPPASEPERRTEAAETKEEVTELDTIVVTGTHIRGSHAAGSKVIVIDREDIEKSGYGRLQDILETVPQNFSGAVSEDWNSDGGAANQTFGQAINLRGVGASSTLILINGRRQPAGGLEGSFVDISSIPAFAVERIEIMTDGASALYGSDAIGGVVNFVLRKGYDGIETRVRVATTDDAAEDLQASVLGGQTWDRTDLLFGYQYSRRNALINAETPYGTLNQDYRSLGGADLRPLGGNPGVILNAAGLPAFAIPENQSGIGLTVAQLIPGQANYQDRVHGVANLPEQTVHSTFFTLTRDFSEWFQGFVEARYAQRRMELPFADTTATASVPSTNPRYLNPFGGTAPVRVRYSFAEDFGGLSVFESDTRTYTAALGGVVRLGDRWQVNVSAAYGRERNEYEQSNEINSARLTACLSGLPTSGCPGAPLNVFGDGANNDPATINYIRESLLGRAVSTMTSTTAIADGPVFRLPAGDARLAVGADYRDEGLDAERSTLAPATDVVTRRASSVGELDRKVKAVFGEIVLPILGQGFEAPGARRLELSVAARWEEYNDFGSTLNPKIGLSYSPIDDLTLRGTWGSAFRAPRFNEISPTARPPSASANVATPDPTSPTGRSTVIFLGGGNPDIQEESADFWTAGLDFRPSFLPDLSLSGVYFDLDYQDKIAVGGQGLNTLVFESQWAEIITRNPTAEQIAAICSRSEFTGQCPQSAAAIVDGRLRNLAIVRVRGVDFDLNYRFGTRAGSIRAGIGGSYVLSHERASTSTSTLADVVDTVGNPLALRARAALGWDVSAWSLNTFVNYADSYADPANQRTVDSWTTIDASLGYRFGQGWMEGTVLQLSVTNALDKEPPFVNSIPGYDGANASQSGRSMSLSISRHW